MRNRWITALCTIVLSIFITSLLDENNKFNGVMANTLYTISGIIFSIGMGVVCTFCPNGILNKNYFAEIKENIINLRATFLFYFTFSTLAFSLSQFNIGEVKFHIYNLTITLDFYILTTITSCISTIFYIFNFFTIQKLNFDIAERIITEKSN